MNETWHKWEPIQGLAPRYDIDVVNDTVDGFCLLLSEDRTSATRIKVSFKNSVESYRVADESFRQKTLLKLSTEYGIGLLGKWTFFEVHNSSYAKWLSEESFQITDVLSLHHFVFVGCNQVVDVLSGDMPNVTLIKNIM